MLLISQQAVRIKTDGKPTYKMQKSFFRSALCKCSKTYKSTPNLLPWTIFNRTHLGKKTEEPHSLNGLYRTGPSQIQEKNLCVPHALSLLFRSPPYELWSVSASRSHACPRCGDHGCPQTSLPACCHLKSKFFFLQDAGIILLLIPSKMQNRISVSSELLQFTRGILEEVRMPSTSRRRFHTFYMHFKLLAWWQTSQA